ncbi:hypothetical protein LR48_Vigan02g261300 [Vigna angularis]|uniref:Uncharacterized protein n=1 Tax=Phaseolus angularis TaxID=3914 RepID=A0A0L9U0Y1_PHAAN|nr:hypothetical protein LR48_Vigan02g261300 [Vigna angularis]
MFKWLTHGELKRSVFSLVNVRPPPPDVYNIINVRALPGRMFKWLTHGELKRSVFSLVNVRPVKTDVYNIINVRIAPGRTFKWLTWGVETFSVQPSEPHQQTTTPATTAPQPCRPITGQSHLPREIRRRPPHQQLPSRITTAPPPRFTFITINTIASSSSPQQSRSNLHQKHNSRESPKPQAAVAQQLPSSSFAFKAPPK